MIRLVAFDLDGTLVDSHRDIADATNAVIADPGGTPLEMSVVTASSGDGAAVLTNKPQQPSVRLLDGLGLMPFFDDVIGGDTDAGLQWHSRHSGRACCDPSPVCPTAL